MSSVNSNTELKSDVKDFWNSQACGTHLTDKEKFTKEYFNEIEKARYEREPEIPEFAEFEKFAGKKILEIGIGAGTDFQNWVRNGAEAYGIDLTEEAIEHVRRRLSLFGLEAKEYRVADCENLPFADNTFDLVYSFGVIHHTPDTPKAFREIVRVMKPGGKAKVMIYHRRSVLVVSFWIKHALLKLRPWKSFRWVLWNHMESIGTKAYLPDEVREILKNQPVKNLDIKTKLTFYDRLGRFNKAMQAVAKIIAALMGGDKAGWFMMVEFEKS